MRRAQYPSQQRNNLIDALLSELNEEMNKTDSFAEAFARVSLIWMGYDPDGQVVFVDGSKDRGVDAYLFADDNLKIFQFKSQDFTKNFDRELAAGTNIVSDVSRIINFIQTKDPSLEVANPKVRQMLSRVQSAISSYNVDITKDELFSITVDIVAMYDGLTPSAESELNNIRASMELIEAFGHVSSCSVAYVDLNELLGRKWHETNSKWQDATGKPTEHIKVKILQTSATS